MSLKLLGISHNYDVWDSLSYQYRIGIFIEDLTLFVIFLVFLSGGLRVYTLFLWNKYNLDSKIFNKYKDL